VLRQAADDIGDDLGRRSISRNGHDRLVSRRFFQCLVLAVEETHRHEMAEPADQAGSDDVWRRFEINE
jgi:hypothetical protein